jgi:protein-tyrosine phosphatase
MSHRYLLILLGLALIAIATINGGWPLLLLWPGANFLILGIAHIKNAPGIFGKRPHGTLPFWSWLIFLPLLLYTNLVWRIACLLNGEPAQNTVTADLIVGRRLYSSEVDGEFTNYIDLTAEFPEPGTIRRLPAYQCFPILDGGIPRIVDLNDALDRLRPGRTFIHCAQGHGRTGLFALALLLKRGIVENPDEGLEKLRATRPGIRLNKLQRQCIESFANSLKRPS